MKTATDLVNEAKARISEVSAERVQEMQERGEPVVYLDVREQNEWNMGHLPRATLIPDIQGSIVGALGSGGTLTKTGYQAFGQNPTLAANGFYYTGRRLRTGSRVN